MNNESPEELPVIFRRPRSKSEFENHGVTAIFPTLPGDIRGIYLTCYAHIGQHGACSFGFYHETIAAKPDEYADLLTELRGIYEHSFAPGDPVYRLQVYRRLTPQHRTAFNREVSRERESRPC